MHEQGSEPRGNQAQRSPNTTGNPPDITRALLDGEEAMRAQIYEQADLSMFMLAVDGTVATWNIGAERLKGYRAEEILGKHFSCFYTADDIVADKPRRELAIAEQDGRCEEEGWRIRKDGSVFWANVIITALRDTGGQLIGFGKVTRNISERRKAHEQFRLAIEAAPTGMLMIDRSGTIVLVNAQVEKLFGYPREELLGRQVEVLVPERFRVRHPGYRDSFFSNPKARAMGGGRELYGLRKDGTEVPIEIGLNPLNTPEGDFVLSSVVDITERKRSIEQFRLAIEAAPTGMIMIERSGAIVLVNAQVEKLFGYTREELLGRPIEVLVPERFRAHHPAFRDSFFSNPKARAMGSDRELYGVRKDGTEIPIEIGLNPLNTPEGDFVLSSVVDITERKRANQEREDLLGQLRLVNTELEERVRVRTSELTATLKEREVLLQEVHHRVKNNLQVITSLINMQLRRIKDVLSREALVECQNRVQAIALIHEKLYQSKDYARVPFSDYARSLASNIFSASGVSPDAVALDLRMAAVSLAVDKAIPCGLILNELISNALKHAFPNARRGTVVVELGAADGGHILLAVGDDGIGMPNDFDPAKSNSLGMQLVFTLVAQLEGQLQIIRQGGTTFRIRFPLAARA